MPGKRILHDPKIPTVSAVLFLIFFTLYLQTAANEVYTADCGELITASYVIGIPHATGYATYCQLNRFIAVSLPFGTVAFRMSLFSSFSAAAAVIFLLLFLDLVFSLPAAILGALLFGSSYTFWSQANIQEVYAFHLFFVCMLLYLAKRLAMAGSERLLFLFAFLSGLALTHHLLISLLLPAIVPYLWPSGRGRETAWKIPHHLAPAAGFFLLGLSGLLYFPIRSHVICAFRWIPCDRWHSFLYHITGKQFRGIMFNQSLEELFGSFCFYINKLQDQFPDWIFLLLIPGWILMFVRMRRDWIVLTAAFFLCASFFLNYRIIDIEVYFIQSYIPLLVFIVAAVDHLARSLTGIKSFFRYGSVMVLGLICLVNAVIRGFWYNDRSGNHLAYEWGINVYNCVPPDGMLVTQGWSSPFTFLYLDHVMSYRPDILFIVDYKGTIFHQSQNENWLTPIVSTLPFDIPGLDENAFEVCGVTYYFVSPYTPGLICDEFSKVMREDSLEDTSIFLDFHSRALKANYRIIEGYWHLEQDDRDGAAKCFQDAERFGFDNALIYNNLSCVHFLLQDYVKAEHFAGRALEIDPNLVPAKHNLGNSLIKMARFDEALSVFERIGENPLSLGRHREVLGYLYLMRGDCRKAVMQLQRARIVSPASRSVGINLANALQQCGELIEAREMLMTLAGEYPGDHEILNSKANVNIALRDFDAAEIDVMQILRSVPDHLEANLALATILSETNRSEKAVELLGRLLLIFPGNPVILNNLGLVCYRAGDLSGAMTCWEQSIDLDPSQEHIRQNLRQLRFDHEFLEKLTSSGDSGL